MLQAQEVRPKKSVQMEINARFENYVFDWDYATYLSVGAYGSSKSYGTGQKLVLKCFKEKRKVLVVREVYETIRESCFALLVDILEGLDMVEENPNRKNSKKCIVTNSPMRIKFPNGSLIIFKGCDKPIKFKSIHDISIVWLEEASEIKYAAFKELRGRLRHPTDSLHMIITTNPVAMETWVFKHFFESKADDGTPIVKLNHMRLYEKKTIVSGGVYYHHSIPEDNAFLTQDYIAMLDEMLEYDPDLYRVARLGHFGPSGLRVLPQFSVASTAVEVLQAVKKLPAHHKFTGMDFGFEESYNAVVDVAVDHEAKILYIYGELYRNHTTDDVMADLLIVNGYKDTLIRADCAEPKAIAYMRKRGLNVRRCKKYKRIDQTRKVKRFKKIICSPACQNTIAELRGLTYKADPQGNYKYDEFNIDPHTFSAIWYALDSYDVVDIKKRVPNSRQGRAV